MSEFIISHDDSETIKKYTDLLTVAKQSIEKVVAQSSQEKWDICTSWYELSKPLARHLRGRYDIPTDASNAFFKCIELLRYVPFADLRHFDNAALPGDFIRATQWHCTGLGRAYDWRANSLVGGLEDKFDLVKNHPQKWMMSETQNGDVTIVDNIEKIFAQLGEWRANLYTSDLGFKFEDRFNEEQEHYAAHVGQINLGLTVLERGGVLIVKCFTISTPEHLTLISELALRFDKFAIAKPETSKADNSECYLVGMGYDGFRGVPIDTDGAGYGPHPALATVSCALIQRQVKKIKENIVRFQNRERVDFRDDIAQWKIKFLNRYGVRR